MSSKRIGSTATPDLFSASSPQGPASRPPGLGARHVLPSDLPAAIKHLNDRELEELLAAAAAEQQRRGRMTTPSDKASTRRAEAPGLTLTVGKLNAVRAAFKAGVSLPRIAKQFGISHAEVRKVLSSDRSRP